MRLWHRIIIGAALLVLLTGASTAAPFAYITNALSNTVSVIDTGRNTVVATIPVGIGPLGVAVNYSGTRVYVSNSVSDTLSVIDTATNAVIATIPVGAFPGGVAVPPIGTRVYVANGDSNNVSIVDTGSNTVVAAVAVGNFPGGIAVNATGSRIYVANVDSNSISVIDGATNAVVATVALGSSPQFIAMSLAGTRLYVTMNAPDRVLVIDTSTNSVVGSIAVGTTPSGIALNPAGTRAYVANSDSNNVSVIDTAVNSVVATVAVGIDPAGLAVNPPGTRVYVANFDSNSVSVLDTTTNTVVATIAVGLKPAALGQFIGPEVVTPPGTKPDLDQHGFTGSWYEAATNGQGFLVEVYPDLSPGSGLAQLSWFTFDDVAGGADHQRWYTLGGPAPSGQAITALTIYQNTGGNFNAPPVTVGHPVGTAILSFASCTEGQLSYAFNDGTGRTGSISLSRLTQNVTCSTTPSHPTNADFSLSGNWFDPATSGQGFTTEVNPNSGVLFTAWYTYMPNGATAGAAGQRWYTAQGSFTPGMRSIPVTIYETTGGMFDTPTPPGQKGVAVGTGTMAFQSCTVATFNYSFTGGTSIGRSGTIALSRVGPVPPGCT